ncbi:MAG: ribosome small subunit-dependent GTPase A [bacterium]|nr:ribosome small subunit-dependent GTPase A [bacterium]
MKSIDMSALGLPEAYAQAAAGYPGDCAVGRVIAQEKGLYRVVSEGGEQFAEVSGKLRHQAKSPAYFPAVGDFVVIERNAWQGHGVIHEILPRKSVFIRKAAGSGNTEQVVAANIDTLFICMSMNSDFNLRRLERYLAVAWDSGATPVVVLTKADFCPDPAQFVNAVSSVAAGTDIVLTTDREERGYEKLLPYIQRGRTVALIGSSGVGKSTLTNHLLGEERLDTNGLRNDGRGRHTTTRRQLFLLEQGGMVIDTPGMRELGLWELEEGLDKSFADIEALAAACRFHDCSHSGEPGCAVRDAIARGELSEERLRSYRKLKAENRYAGDAESYLAEKRQKFKDIAKSNKKNQKLPDKGQNGRR